MNASGGLEAKGHPLGATGIGMHFYIMSKFLPCHQNIADLSPVQLRECAHFIQVGHSSLSSHLLHRVRPNASVRAF